MAVTSARLAERLNLDPSSRLQPMTAPLEPIELIDPNLGVEELIRRAIGQRPDLANRRALLAEADVPGPQGEVPAVAPDGLD